MPISRRSIKFSRRRRRAAAAILLTVASAAAAFDVAAATSASASARLSQLSSDRLGAAWLNDVDISLRSDRDADGYYSRLVISLDVDADEGRYDGYTDGYGGYGDDVDLYAVIGLYDSAGRERLVYETNDFSVYGNSSYEDYRVDLELVDDYPADYFDLVVELRARDRGELLDVVDAGDFRALGGLALEDAYRDGQASDTYYGEGYGNGYYDSYYGYYVGASSFSDDGSSYAAVEYAGGFGPAGLGMLGLGLVLLRRRRAVAR